jgi:hypothetical protein
MRATLRSAAVLACLLVFAAGARAELLAWDQARVTELAKQLDAATSALTQSFRRQPPLTKGAPHRQRYFRLQQEVRHLDREARSMSRALQRGADLDETLPSFDSMMVTVRRAQDDARRVFTVAEMHERADAVRAVLNQLAPYFDPGFTPLEPPARR